MFKKYILPAINIVFPYSVLGFLIVMFNFSKSIMLDMLKDIMGFDPYACIGGIFLWFLGCLACNIIYMHDMIKNRHDAKVFLKQYMIIKCAQIPAYVLIFCIGVLCLITIFTMPFSFILWVCDCQGVLLTGLLGVAVSVRAYQEGMIKKSTAILCGMGSFIFCLDVIIAVVLYRGLSVNKDNNK